MSSPNPSTALARALIDEFHRNGVEYAVISPGSRSAALAIAADQHPDVETVVVLDERSAGFHALGRSLASGRPVLAIATSGTAVANYLPAVVEADLSGVPVILLSADRPPELLGVGANQTIDQVKIFGGRVRQFAVLDPAEASLDQNGLWRSTVSQLVARSVGHGSRPGPVHLNVAFREPTVPASNDGRSAASPYQFPTEGREGGGPWQSHSVAPAGIDGSGLSPQRGLVIAGQGDYDRGQLLRAVTSGGWPLLATAPSGLRSNEGMVTTYHHLLVDGVPASLRPDAVITVGQIGPSDRLAALTRLEVSQVQVDRWGRWLDPRRHATHLAQADPAVFLSEFESQGTRWRELWLEADHVMGESLDRVLEGGVNWTGPGIARSLSGRVSGQLVVASSMPIRDVDAHTRRTGGPVLSNRGASGIDGFVSTALGAASTGAETVALSGDLSFLHDLGGLVADHLPAIVFVVVDNGGGGLFDLLPQAEHAPGFDRLFFAPHHRDLDALATAHGLGVVEVGKDDVIADQLRDARVRGGAQAILIGVDREADLKLRRSLDEEALVTVSKFS